MTWYSSGDGGTFGEDLIARQTIAKIYAIAGLTAPVPVGASIWFEGNEYLNLTNDPISMPDPVSAAALENAGFTEVPDVRDVDGGIW